MSYNRGHQRVGTSNEHTWKEAEGDITHAFLVLACHQSLQRQQPGNGPPGIASLSPQDEMLLPRPRDIALSVSIMATDVLESKSMSC